MFQRSWTLSGSGARGLSLMSKCSLKMRKHPVRPLLLQVMLHCTTFVTITTAVTEGE